RTEANNTGPEGHDGMLEATRGGKRGCEKEVRRPLRHRFLFIGADPNTDWLSGSGIRLDSSGFVLTGRENSTSRHPLETSRRRIYAIGDLRSGSVKRVASGGGEGAQVVAGLPPGLASVGATPRAP